MLKSITLQLTTQCSLNCPYCFAQKLIQHNISAEDFEYFYAFCKQNKPDQIHLTGGEPSMHPFFSEMINRLLEVSAVTVYSNLTIPNTWNHIKESVADDLTVLVNFNDRIYYSDIQWKTFQINLVKLIELKCNLVFSHTFFLDSFEADFNNIFQHMQKYGISNLRVSQYVDNRKNKIGLNFHQVRFLYDYIAEHIEGWQSEGYNVFFDCAVPPCYIKHETFHKLNQIGVLGTKCCPKAFVLWDLSVTHCYTTLDHANRKHLSEFKTVEQIVLNSAQILCEILNDRGRTNCSACSLNTRFCNCPDYHILPEKRIPSVCYL